jgi:glycosyltransferase involved in cell wall biosynthesis
MVEASVIICAHNPRPHYLRRVLSALRNQTLSKDRWELLLIDNASEDPLASKTWDLSWHPHARHIREEVLGLSSARLRGMQESFADLLVFVDDDNVLDPNYLSEAISVKNEWPQLGVWGSGSILPEFEVQPPDYVREFLDNLALREVSGCHWSNIMPCDGAKPWGAGQCVRASVAKAYRRCFEESLIRITDRRGNDLASGGDIEIDYVACNLGLGVGIFPELKIIHLIPAIRLEEEYLVRIVEGSFTSSILLDFKWRNKQPSSPFSGLGWLVVLVNIYQKKGIYRRMYIAWLRATLRARRIISSDYSARAYSS